MHLLDPDLAVSDLILLLDGVLAVILALVFALGKPRAWFRDPLGWVIFNYAVATVALLFLIGWAIITGEKLLEVARLPIALALGFALTWKTAAIIRERQAGSNEGTQHMSTNDNQRGAFGDVPSVTRDASGNPTLTPSPKIAAAGLTMGGLVVVVAMLGAITPDMLNALGSWGPVVFAGIVALGGFLAGYIKRP